MMEEGKPSVLGEECGYCGQPISIDESHQLPLECVKCHGLFHLDCLKGKKPSALMGDQLFHFTCALCDSLGVEYCIRPSLQWVHVLHLVLYNLIVKGEGRKGFFRWNEDICKFIQANWDRLMPHRKKTQSWHSTVAGALSVHCPALFQSGLKHFGEHGWWSLTKLAPPDPRVVIGEGKLLGKRSSSAPAVESPSKRIHLMERRVQPSRAPPTITEPVPKKKEYVLLGNAPSIPEVSKPREAMTALTERQEGVLLEHLSGFTKAVTTSPKAARLLRKLKVRDHQRRYGIAPFDLDDYIDNCLSQTVKYVVDGSKPHYEQIIPDLQPHPNSKGKNATEDDVPSSNEVLDRLTCIPVLSRPLAPENTCFEDFLSGQHSSSSTITSPYTARVLKPFIFQSSDIRPAKVSLLEDIVRHYQKKVSISDYTRKSVDFCYLQEHHLRAVNALVSHFFWPVDLSECLQYPDFTVVVLYGKLVIGCGFMTPDVKVNEAYISFLVVHPDFSGAGIGKLMLYHLIQTCMGKDVTLHVSVDNPALLLYQGFGFKAEQYCLDFYDKYYPVQHHLSKNAYFMRLRR